MDYASLSQTTPCVEVRMICMGPLQQVLVEGFEICGHVALLLIERLSVPHCFPHTDKGQTLKLEMKSSEMSHVK